jgi:ribosomal protein L11 methyltransferase
LNIYTVLSISITPTDMGNDLLISELGDIGFDGFLEEEHSFDASIPSEQLDRVQLDALIDRFREAGFSIAITERSEADRNWNEEWEKNFDPVVIGDLCRIRAPFHSHESGFRLEITIMPRMSFGTGHHSTTAGMIRLMMTHPLRSPLLDMGSGTAVLAIVARKLGVADVTAIDIDEWAFDNAPDNCALNDISDITVLMGDASLLGGKTFGTILANINRNVLLEDIPKYAAVLEKGGSLFLSGFYTEDLSVISAKAEECGLRFVDSTVEKNWVAAVFEKKV